jgi:hypothetical protein
MHAIADASTDRGSDYASVAGERHERSRHAKYADMQEAGEDEAYGRIVKFAGNQFSEYKYKEPLARVRTLNAEADGKDDALSNR